MIPIIIAAIESPEDRDLMTDFFLEHKGLLYLEASKHLSSAEDIEDIVYEALAKIIDKMDVFRDLQAGQRLKYAMTTVRNLSYILLKRNSLITMVPLETLEFDLPYLDGITLESIVEKKILNEHIKKIWNELDLDARMLLEQKYTLKWKDEELASALGIKPQSVRMRLTRAKRSLFDEMQRKGFNLADYQ